MEDTFGSRVRELLVVRHDSRTVRVTQRGAGGQRKVGDAILEPIEVVEGGLMARSGIKIPEMGDKSDEFVIAVAAITIGY